MKMGKTCRKREFGWWKCERSHTINLVRKNSGSVVGPQPASKEDISFKY
jgi:hypothetical protein